MTLFITIKFVHILLAIVAVGFNASYGVWLARAAQNPTHAAFALRGVKLLDDRFANPAYGLLLVSGVAMVFVSPYPWSSFWIDAALVLWVIAILWGLLMYTPTLRRQIEALEAHGFESPEYQAMARRGQIIGVSNMLPILLILIMMVFKPTF
jgi:uncharacterized membrane protein